jgi:membrane protein implicated in regulation of membrane protease activity
VALDAVMISWIIIAVACFLAELVVPQFFIFWFGVGSIGALVSHFLGVSYPYQWVVFAVISLAGLILTRRFARMILKKEPKKAGVGRLIDEVMLVTRDIDNTKGVGQVRGRGDIWRAISEDGTIIKEGSKVKVISVEGVSLVVRLEEDTVHV